MPFYSPGNNSIDMLLQKLAAYNRKVTALPDAVSNVNAVLTLNGISYQSDGTRWLSVQKFALPIGTRGTMPFPQATAIFNVDLANLGASGVYVTDLECAFRPLTVAQSGVNFYTLTFTVSSASVVTTIVLTGAGQADTTLSTTAGNRYSMKPTFTPTAFDSTYFWGEVTMTPSGAPGTFIFFGTVGYRLIGA